MRKQINQHQKALFGLQLNLHFLNQLFISIDLESKVSISPIILATWNVPTWSHFPISFYVTFSQNIF